VILGFLGVFLIARPWRDGDGTGFDLCGVGYMVLGSLSIGSSFVYARRFMANLNISPLALSTYQVGFALCILAVVTPFSGLGNIGHSAVALTGLVLGLGLTGTGAAYVLYYYIVQRMGAVQASTVMYLPAVVALLVGCLLVGEPLTLMDLIAMSAILGGVYATQTSRSARSPPDTANRSDSEREPWSS
jgi:drug/metabolite transporter (DMT)-like permease